MRQVVLLSGGIDSLLCAEIARQASDLAGCVFVDYGHPAQIVEGWHAFAWCGSRGVPLLAPHVRDLDLGDMADGVGTQVVPHRNALLLALAANAARRLDGEALTIGANADDQRDYADCRPAFLNAMSAALGMPILTPLLGMTKADVVRTAAGFRIKPGDAWSCYGPGPQPCGTCESCQAMLAARR